MRRDDEVVRDLFLRVSEEDEVRALRLAAWLRGLRCAAPLRTGGLELVPLQAEKAPRTADLLFRDARDSGVLEVRERGGVAEGVEAVNRGGVPVLILEGESLSPREPRCVAAKSILVPPRAAVTLPVGLVERRRWAERSAGPREVWPRPAPAPDSLPAKIPARGQVGVVALRRGRLLGVELASHPRSWASLAPRSTAGYAAAADGETGAHPAGGLPGAADWIERLAAARVVSRPARGIGLDLALLGEGIEGGALWHDGRALHLVAFPS
jgi:hypothetical protein